MIKNKNKNKNKTNTKQKQTKQNKKRRQQTKTIWMKRTNLDNAEAFFMFENFITLYWQQHFCRNI